MKYILVNYNSDTSWIMDYTDDFLIYDRSDDGVDRGTKNTIKTKNFGHCDYDKLCYLVDNYDNLPDVFFWGKVNLWKSISKEEFEPLKNATTFTPLLTQNHRTYSDKFGVVCYYQDDMYYERNDSWYLYDYPAKYSGYADFARDFQLPNPSYLPFAPGGNYILTRDVVHRYARDYYERMRDILPYCQLPGEAQMCERSYYTLWK